MFLIEERSITHTRARPSHIGHSGIDGIAHIRYLPADDAAFIGNSGPTDGGQWDWSETHPLGDAMVAASGVATVDSDGLAGHE
jgi:hypothetical protein